MSWDRTKPAASTLGASAEMRSNFQAIDNSLASTNLIADSIFLIWAAGDSSAPTHWTLSGTGATIARCGTGLGDTNRKVGSFCPKVTFGSAAAVLTQSILTTGAYDDYFDGLVVTMGCWVKTSSISQARIRIDDGFATTDSSYHTGGGSWEWLTVTRTIDASATKVAAALRVEVAGGAYFSGPTFYLGQIPPQIWTPSPIAYGTLFFPVNGTQTVTNSVGRFVPARPFIVRDCVLRIETSPTGAALKVDLKQWDGAAFTSMYSTLPQIAISGTGGAAAPDSTYKYRCFSGVSGSVSAAGTMLRADVTQVGSTIAGSDLTIHARVLQYMRPLELLLGVADFA